MIRALNVWHTLLSRPLASILKRLGAGDKIELPKLAPAIGGTWGSRRLDEFWGPLRVESASVLWDSIAKDGEPSLGWLFNQLDSEAQSNKSARLELADGTTLVAEFGHWVSRGTRTDRDLPAGETIAFDLWNVETLRPCRWWVGALSGGGAVQNNFYVDNARGLRLEGNYTWFLVDHNDRITALIDASGEALDRHKLGCDFNALQYSLGEPLELPVLIGLDEPGNVCSAMGPHLGGNRPTRYRRRADGPIPDDWRDEAWIPIFFHSLARASFQDASLPWATAVVGYLDSSSDATIEGQYLKLHVTIEAFASALAQRGANTTRAHLVNDVAAWRKWVTEHADELRNFAELGSSEIFVNKVRDAMNAPSSGAVQRALASLEPPLVIDDELLTEVGRRNLPVHRFTMLKPNEEFEVERDVDRIHMLRTLLTALVSRAAGYGGPISGWSRKDQANWKPTPSWWPSPPDELAHAARERFRYPTPTKTVREKPFRSRIRTR